MTYTTLFFDLDDTLYPANNGLWDAIAKRIVDYMRLRVGIPDELIPTLRRQYYETYGTTMKGLIVNHHIDANDYLTYVHDLRLENYLQPDLELQRILTHLPQRKWIFTNADAAHAQRVVAALKLEACFDGILDVMAIGPHCKPEPQAYLRALSLAREDDPHRCVLLDDLPRNLAPARAIGFTAVLVGGIESDSVAHYTIPRLHDLPKVMPELLEELP